METHRGFGRDDSLAIGRRLADDCRARRLVFLVGADEALAEALDADGLKLPERLVTSPPDVRRRHPGWLITGAAQSPEALSAAAEAGLGAALLSPVFASSSLSAGEPIGVETFAAWTGAARPAVHGLGGITSETAPRLAGSGACGLAFVAALTQGGRVVVCPGVLRTPSGRGARSDQPQLLPSPRIRSAMRVSGRVTRWRNESARCEGLMTGRPRSAGVGKSA